MIVKSILKHSFLFSHNWSLTNTEHLNFQTFEF